jgi:hypothetical protein
MAVSFEEMQVNRDRVVDLDFELNGPDDDPTKGIHDLDSADSKKKLSKIKQWWHETRQAHSENRMEQAIDTGFYDGEQWRAEDAKTVKDRGQHPAVHNKTAQHINWLLGTERRTRVDYKIHPRGDEDVESAITKTQLLKYVSDVNKTQFTRSRAWGDAVKAGVGWIETGIRSDPTEEPLFNRFEHWRNMWWDHLAKETDLSDARYLFRSKWIDTDILKAMIPDRSSAIERAARSDQFNNNQWMDDDEPTGFTPLFRDANGNAFLGYGKSQFDTSFTIGNRRKRNRVIECWYQMPAKATLFKGTQFPGIGDDILSQFKELDGRPFNDTDETMASMVESGLATTYDAIQTQIFVAMFTGDFLLMDQESPYNHKRYPFIPIWCYRRDRDGMPYGPIRNMRDAQEDLNKRKSKALFIMSTNQIIAEEDAFDDWDEAIAEAARPDGVIKHRRGAEFSINRELQLAAEHITLMELDMQFLADTSGVTEENLGEINNVSSGTAINLRQVQGSVVTALLFDNLRESIQCQGEIELSLIEQFYAEPKKIRIVNDRGRAEFSSINTMGFDENGMPKIENPITESAADFIVDTQDFRESMRLAMFDQLMEMTTRLDPEVTMQILDLVVELSDVHGKDEIVRRIRRINGQTDPDDPNRDEIEAENDRIAQEDQERENAETEAGTAAKQGTAARSQAEAAGADAAAAETRSTTMLAAVEIVASLKGDKNLARAVDVLMDSFETGGDAEPAAAVGAPTQELDTETVFTPQEEEAERLAEQNANSASQE